MAESPRGKLRVRALWSEDAIDNERLRPLGKRLINVFDESLRRSERIALVHHLEVATSKEESLLLLLGLSRLPGGRQFAPQADATISCASSKETAKARRLPTRRSIGVRLRKGAGYQGDWLTTAGLVRDFDALVPQAWRTLARSLREVRAETATMLLDEMSLRRKQAEAEVQIVKAVRKPQPSGINDAAKIRIDAAMHHAEAASSSIRATPRRFGCMSTSWPP